MNTNVHSVIIGDEGFVLNDNLLRPYRGTYSDNKKRVFIYQLTRARRFVKCVFGILSNKWRIFHQPLNVNVFKGAPRYFS